MPRRKKSLAASVLRGFRFAQPFIGFKSQFRTLPVSKKSEKPRTHAINYGGSCREELIWDTREFLQSRAVSWKAEESSWKKTPVRQYNIDIDHPSLKQPGVTCLWASTEAASGDAVCGHQCCTSRLLELLDAVAGTVAVVLNEDRYVGNWWTTSPKEAAPNGPLIGQELRWYGTDNFFLRHPVLTSLMMGTFRQALLLFGQGFDKAILRAVDRKNVEDCLTSGDPELAMKILTTLKPWIAVPQKLYPHNFPFPQVYWGRLGQLHKAIHRYGYDELFGDSVVKGWGLDRPGNRYSVSSGPMDFFGTTGSRVTATGKLLARLGK